MVRQHVYDAEDCIEELRLADDRPQLAGIVRI